MKKNIKERAASRFQQPNVPKIPSPILAAVMILLLAGCITPTIIKPLQGSIDLKQFKTIKLEVKDWVETPYSRDGVPMFAGLLKGKLQSLGYSIIEIDEDLAMEIRITRFEPGSEAKRFSMGWGAGRALLMYTASFLNRSGDLIAEMEGGKAYTGQEFNDHTLYKTNEQIEMGMIVESVIQIGHFIQNNGKLEESRGP